MDAMTITDIEIWFQSMTRLSQMTGVFYAGERLLSHSQESDLDDGKTMTYRSRFGPDAIRRIYA